MSSKIPETDEEKVKVKCPSCNKTLAVLATYSGTVGCPHCTHVFQVHSSINGANSDGDEEYLGISITQDRNFWIGLVVPIMAPIITLALLMTGIHQPSSPDILGVFWFMCSLCLCPIIGFSIAFSRETFVKSFRAGARISAMVALGIALFAWASVFMWISGGVTN